MIKKNNRKKLVAVIGIGRVGFPLALVLANSGFYVYGIEKDAIKAELINKGKMPFMEDGAKKILKKVIGKNFTVTPDYSCIEKCDYIILTLGTPIDENMNPILDQVCAAVNSMRQFLRPGQTLILRSTVSPGTTQYVKSMLEDLNSFKIGKNFFLAFCPERIAEGRAIREIETIPQMIGGLDRKSSIKAQELFRKIGVKTIISDDISAELAKLFTNMYRYINLAIANEFMVLADSHKRDIHEIINLVNFGYTRGGLNSPGLTGGPCLFKDGFFLISDLPFGDLISTSWKINESIPLFLVKKVKNVIQLKNKKVTILGMAFKAEIDDIRESLSFKVRKALFREQANVTLQDPYTKEYQHQKIEQDVYKAVENADLIFIGTNHNEYKRLDIKKIIKNAKKNCLVCDVWNVFGTGKILFPLKDVVLLKSKLPL
ncbi:MAG: nucleotide sugar dehydrogenase [Patescibacteria group bacterium]|nr:nucleotide sugar dehydrogenase [Patescibacteria group bacterium]